MIIPGQARELPARAWARALEITARATCDPERTLPRAIADLADEYGDAPALVSERELLSFAALAARMNRYSRWALSKDVRKGETVALVMGNRPEYFAIWLGLIQVGAIVALISPNLPAAALAHALRVASARRAIAAGECADLCSEAVASLDNTIEIWIHGNGGPKTRAIDLCLSVASGEPLAEGERRAVTLADRALRIFTSGTTGLPKAAEVSHQAHRRPGAIGSPGLPA